MLQTAGERIAPDKNPHCLQLDVASVKEIGQNEEKKKQGQEGTSTAYLFKHYQVSMLFVFEPGFILERCCRLPGSSSTG